MSLRLEFAILFNYTLRLFQNENNPPSAFMGIASVARLGGKSGPIWQHWRRRHLTILSSFISECYKSHFVGVCCPPGSHGSHVTAKYEFTTRIPSKLAYIRHSDQKLMHSQQLFQNSSKARMTKSHFELTRD